MTPVRLDVSLQSQYYPGAVPNSLRATAPGWFLVNTNALSVSYTTGTGTLTTPVAHGLSVGNWVWFVPNPSTATTPWAGAPFTAWQRYFVVSVGSSTTFQVSATAGGTAITTGSSGSGTYISSLTGMTHTLYLQPQRFGETWTVQRVTVQSNSLTLVPTASIYKSVISPSALIDQTQNGQQDTDDLNSPLILLSGETAIIQFTMVDPPTPNAPALCTVWLGGETAR